MREGKLWLMVTVLLLLNTHTFYDIHMGINTSFVKDYGSCRLSNTYTCTRADYDVLIPHTYGDQVDVPRNSVIELNISVFNNGSISVSFPVSIYIYNVSNSWSMIFENTTTVSNLEGGTGTWVYLGTVKLPSMVGVVWSVNISANLSSDPNPTNNYYNVTVTTIKIIDIGIKDYFPKETSFSPNTTIKYILAVENLGDPLDTVPYAHCIIRSLENGSEVFNETKAINLSSTDAQVWVNFTEWISTIGLYEVKLFLNLTGDQDPDNNVVVLNIEITGVIDIRVDDIVLEYQSAPRTPVATSTPIQIYVHIHNNGTLFVNNAYILLKIYEKYNPSNMVYTKMVEISNLDALTLMSVSCGVWTTSTEGYFVVSAMVNTQDDVNTSNNNLSKEIEVRDFIDLGILDIGFHPADHPLVGDEIYLSVTIYNNGSMQASDAIMNITIKDSDNNTIYYNQKILDTILAYSSLYVDFDTPWIPTKPGIYNIICAVNVEEDADPSNNGYTINIDVSSHIDVQILAIQYPIDGESYYLGDLQKIDVSVKNSGNDYVNGYCDLYIYSIDENQTKVLNITFNDYTGLNLTNGTENYWNITNGMIIATNGSGLSPSETLAITFPMVYIPEVHDIRAFIRTKYNLSDGDTNAILMFSIDGGNTWRYEYNFINVVDNWIDTEIKLDAGVYGGHSVIPRIVLDTGSGGPNLYLSIDIFSIYYFDEALIYSANKSFNLDAKSQQTITFNYWFNTTGKFIIRSVVRVVGDLNPENNVGEVSIKILERPVITNPPTAIISSPSDGDVLYTNKNIEFIGYESYDPDGSIMTYMWYINGDFVSEQKNFTYVFKDPGVYSIMLKVIDDMNLTSIATISITILRSENIYVVEKEWDEGYVHVVAYFRDYKGSVSISEYNMSELMGFVVLKAFNITIIGVENLTAMKVTINYTAYLSNRIDPESITVMYRHAVVGEWRTIGLTQEDRMRFKVSFNKTIYMDAIAIVGRYLPPAFIILRYSIESKKGTYFVGEAIKFSAIDTESVLGLNLTYEWDFGDGIIGIGPVVEHAYKETGEYVVTLTVRDEANHTNTTQFKIKVTKPTDVKGVLYNVIYVILGIMAIGVLLFIVILKIRAKREIESEMAVIYEEPEISVGGDEVVGVDTRTSKPSSKKKVEKVEKEEKEGVTKKEEKPKVPVKAKAVADDKVAKKVAVVKEEPTKPTKMPVKAPLKVPVKTPREGKGAEEIATKVEDKAEGKVEEGEEVGEVVGEEEGSEVEEEEEPKKYEIPERFPFLCPKCGNELYIPSDPEEYPLKVRCDVCGARGSLKTLPKVLLKDYLDREGIEYDPRMFEE